MFRLLLSIPLFAYLLIAFNVIVFIGFDDPLKSMNTIVFSFTLTSGAQVVLTISSVFLLAGVACLYLEILKSTRNATFAIIDHGLSMLVFVVYLVEFVAVAQVGNSTFLILTLMTLIDVIAGFTVTISTARRDISLG